MRRSIFLAVAALAALAAPALGRDWFVRAGSEGDGSKEKPFKDPYLALEKAEAGDTIHVAGGVYHGKLDTANWVIDVPHLTMLGGYDAAFATRDPWKNPTELRFVKDLKAQNEGTLLKNGRDAAGFVVDGFVFDQKEHNAYAEGEFGDIDFLHTPRHDLVDFRFTPGVEVRNCLVVNGAAEGLVLLCNGCKVENNVFMSCAGPNLVDLLTPAPGVQDTAKPALVKGNTFLFAWSEYYGTGRYDGSGLKLWSGCKAEIVDNVFMNCDNYGVYMDTRPDRVVLKNNVSWMNAFANVHFPIEGSKEVAVDNSNMGDLDDAGFKACEGNEAKDPEVGGFDPKWMERYTNRTSAEHGKVTMDDWNKMRQILGLPLVGEGGKGPSGFCMAYDWRKALAIVPKAPQGAHPRTLEVKLATGASAAAQKYDPTTWEVFTGDTKSIDGKRVELLVLLGGDKSQYYFPGTGVNEKEWMGLEIYDAKDPSGLPPFAYFRRGTNAEKTVEAARRWGSGADQKIDRYAIRGVARLDESAQVSRKYTFLIEQIELFKEAPATAKARPLGRDWFVRAGSSGNGSKEKPFKDPWQALEQAEAGDAIHVAEGEYFGRLGTGFWTVDIRYISMLGGYDKDFKERDPWKHPTRLGFKPGSKARTAGAFIRTDDDHTGFVLDGFVLDGKDVNAYLQEGDLDPGHSAKDPLVGLGGSPDCVVRNCVLLNGSLGSIETTADHGVIENNIILNFHWQSVMITPGRNEQPWVVRNNTILFAWYDRADGKGGTSEGTGVYTRGDVAFELENNVIAYDDEQAVFTSSPPARVKMTGNVFSRDLFAHFTNGQEIAIDDANMAMLKDCGFVACDGNATIDPQLPLDKAWMEVFLNRTMSIPGKVTMDDWNKTREILGLPLVAEGGERATGYARAYDWKQALALVPRNPACKAGARPIPLEVKFNPNPPPRPEPKTYDAAEFKAVQDRGAPLDGKAVEFAGKIGEMRDVASARYLDDVNPEAWGAVLLMGPEGKESGFPVTAYYRRDTRLEKALKKSDEHALYKLRGIARKGSAGMAGCMILEAIEKAD
jgi:hypothetical protein